MIAAEVRQFEDSENFRVEAATGLALQSIGVSGTPTAALVWRAGRISGVWRGAPGQRAQDAMRTALITGL